MHARSWGQSEPAIGDATAQLKNRRPICAEALRRKILFGGWFKALLGEPSMFKVKIVEMVEKLHSILSRRAHNAIYMSVHVRLNAISLI